MAIAVEENKVQTNEASSKPSVDKFELAKFLGEVKTEFYKISWPSKDQVTKEFTSVLILVSLLTGIIYVIDKVFEVITNYFMGR